MGTLLSAKKCSEMISFLALWNVGPKDWELTGVRGVSREELGLMEGEDDLMNNILSVEFISGVWRIEVLLPNGGRMVVSDPGSFQAAMTKARRMEPDVEPA